LITKVANTYTLLRWSSEVESWNVIYICFSFALSFYIPQRSVQINIQEPVQVLMASPPPMA
jgi:hypothetical protein